MSPWQIAALIRRHAVAVGVVLLLATGLAYHLKHEDPGYLDSATIAFVLPNLHIDVSPIGSVLVTDELVTNSVMSTRGHEQVKAAGGAANYNVTLVNLYNEEFPNYGVPYVTVTTSSPSPVAAQQTFSAVMSILRKDLASLQAAQGAKPHTWIGLRMISVPTGPLAQVPYTKRILGAMLVLTVIASLLVAKFLDRHPIKLRKLLRRAPGLPRTRQGPARFRTLRETD